MIFRNYFLINLVLLVLISFLGMKAYDAFMVSVELPSETGPAEVKQKEIPITPNIGFPGESVFQVISDKNIFSPSRALVVKKADNIPGQAVSREVPKLFGTIIIGSSRSAMLKDPETKNTKRYYVNDRIGDFVVTDIQEDRVVLSRGDEAVEIKLRDEKNTTTTKATPPTLRERKVIPVPNIKMEKPVRVDNETPVNTEEEVPVPEEVNDNPQ